MGGDGLRREFHELLLRLLTACKRDQLKLKIPRPLHLMQRNPGMHYHFRPEIFVQVTGVTRFRFPSEGMVLLPDEVAVLPSGLPHGETALGDEGRPFRNFVIGFYSSSVSMHFAAEHGGGKPDIETISFYSTPDLQRLMDMVDYLVRLRHSTSPQSDAAVQGLALALFAVLTDLAGAETPHGQHDSQRIFQVKWLVRDQLYNPDLNVTFMAQRLGCSADYLSHVFHKETGETLIHYIHRQRMNGAIEVLGNPALSISEIAWACGFADAGYFTRVFRKHTGLTPLAYRAKHANESQGEKARPKTVYHDHEDFSPGAPVAS
ncbi:MAG TPA: helix-turn-helix transcriptional regulator [Rariglobus sp.]